ncbi:mannitol 2-dehydrogenase [Rhodobium orientis]|uniref:Mannitol dehydrogenase n=1 Tax=Rhodobium orientis TaxID=34017 RepID=A0A327JSR1_9HYPH|nr:mannitol dehydrogenase family protein [Rhodobium orientis]MBB4303717.1 mannitol 2-dehydrogenase [Rhodobium orientis]MBK5951828.1 mannitol dehydrogenase [Rhodobium orientis]RAI28504.1 mannitol dehydrogenase [Rhodobium orientis]
MALKLSNATLGDIGATIAVPHYDRTELTAGILHIGVGNFHRAHQAVYLDALFNTGRDHGWAIVGAGIMESDEAMRATLAAQDYLTTVVEQEADRSIARVTGPMIDFIPPADRGALIDRLADPEIRIVSLTITEGGYFINPATGVFDPGIPAIAGDAAEPGAPKTVFGILVAGLKRRREEGTVPFTVMSCDNIPHNGIVTRNAVVGLAALSDQNLADWIAAEVAFPNAMVDRITPATGERERTITRETFGIDDAAPVFCEDFKQWVLEDNFTCGRPALEEVGVQFVPDVTPFEIMKIRILNGGHAVIGYPAGLMGIHFVHEAMTDDLVLAFLRKVEREEIVPIVPPVPDTDLADYYALIERRFANPKIGDTARRLCLDGSNRQPKFIVPSIADNLRAGRGVSGLALESALWCRYCFGTTDSGAAIAPNDPIWDRLTEQAKCARNDPDAWLEMTDIYGDVAAAPAFREAFAYWLGALWANGTHRTLEAYLAEPVRASG